MSSEESNNNNNNNNKAIDQVREFATKFRAAFPDFNFWGYGRLDRRG
ncbi:MAG: hypothetical protein ACR2JG_12590 [Geodermatophilaceae bacterium]